MRMTENGNFLSRILGKNKPVVEERQKTPEDLQREAVEIMAAYDARNHIPSEQVTINQMRDGGLISEEQHQMLHDMRAANILKAALAEATNKD